MKKTLIALMIATVTAPAFANQGSQFDSENSEPMFHFDPMQAEQFAVQGSVGLGGYYDTASKALYDDWATAITIAVNYENNRLLGYMEVDLEFNYRTNKPKNANSAAYDINTGLTTDVDKAWIGYDLDYGVFSLGWENDTALDDVNGAGDFTYEFGSSAGTSDAFSVVKFEGGNNVVYGVSYFETKSVHSQADQGINGYLGYEDDKFSIYAGYENQFELVDLTEDSYYVATIAGNAEIMPNFELGANIWIEETKYTNNKTNKNLAYYISGGYQINDYWNVAAGYFGNNNQSTGESDHQSSYVNVSAVYTPEDKIEIGADLKQEIDASRGESAETYLFAVGYYYF